MSLLLSKIATGLAMPLSLACALLVVSLLAQALGRRRLATACVALAVALLWLTSAPATSARLRRPLESQYPPRRVEELPQADVILLLGGGTEGRVSPRTRVEVNAAGDRVIYAAVLQRAGKAPVVLASGGAYSWSGEEPDSHYARELLLDLGVPGGAIEVEPESRTTRENCLRVKERFGGRALRVLLVTSALHMPRAMASCRSVGLAAIPATTDVEVVGITATGWLAWLPDAETLDASERAVKEYLGLTVYWARGWLQPVPAGGGS